MFTEIPAESFFFNQCSGPGPGSGWIRIIWPDPNQNEADPKHCFKYSFPMCL